MPNFELFGAASCPFTRELREWLDWKGCDFIQYDVEADANALERMQALTGQRAVPVLVENGKVVQIGWQGRSCVVSLQRT
ncbi:MAG: glutathione S-transferase N-terminal domain-containing protein [Acidobacteriaceae bacterium]|nr:glutathione S-transferase N-terminal domain-containing protein [Acidobacteriaceae bacterium]MBV9500875.1 glutathione S-transferase N-terminal domain-containing protein [Acidobacteriaceae bacterium]